MSKRNILPASILADAVVLRGKRPAVIPGTNVIPDDAERAAYYARVTAAMEKHGLKAPCDIAAFCDVCGVPE